MPQRNHWPADVRARALALFVDEGVAVASAETGVPRGTIKSWASRGGEVLERAEVQRRSIVAHQRSAAERRAVLIDKLGQVAELGVDWALEVLQSGDDLTVRDVVGAWTRAIHDMQLLSGEATGRSESIDPAEARRRAGELVDELEQRRARKAS